MLYLYLDIYYIIHHHIHHFISGDAVSACMDAADDLRHLHPHPGPHILTRLPHQHEGRVLHRFFIEANIFLSAENIFFSKYFIYRTVIRTP